MTTRRAAVLGSPIAHSLSPVLHRAAYQRLGLTDWRYEAFDVDERSLPGFLDGLGPSWAGLSLTMPLKRAVLPLVDTLGESASAVGAVNTVVFGPEGARRGENTDVPGLVAALAERGVTGAASAAVLGGGATAASAMVALGSITRGRVDVYVRSLSRVAELWPIAERLGIDVRVRPWEEAEGGLAHEVVVNTTPAGAADELAGAVTKNPGTLLDVLYHPWPTALARAWQQAGGSVLGGLDLLTHQGVLQVELMTGRGAGERAESVAVMRQAGLARLAARSVSGVQG